MNDRHPDRWGSTPIPAKVAERAATKYVIEGECYLSTYSRASHGYAQVGWHDGARRHGTTAHRAAWVHHRGQIPIGMTVDHDQDKCGNRPCVRIEHLRLLSNLDNARRTDGRNWALGQCLHGHPDSEWVIIGGKGKCGVCNAKWQADYRKTIDRDEYNRKQREYRARRKAQAQ